MAKTRALKAASPPRPEAFHPRTRTPLNRVDPRSTPGVLTREQAEADTARNVARIGELATILWADNRFGILVLFQGMDTAGKGGVIKNVFTGTNPQGCKVVSFKAPSPLELEHDFLWRIHQACPPRGEIAVFDRSHYEDVGIVRVHDLIPTSVWKARYAQINAFEHHLVETGTLVVKFFLHISKEEQRERLLVRIRDPLKGWKMSQNDITERALWPDYMAAYSEALSRCSTPHAPWYVIPADRKWYRDFAVSTILRAVLEGMDLRIPTVKLDRPRLERLLRAS